MGKKKLPYLFYVVVNGGDQELETGVFFFIPQLVEEFDADLLSIQVGGIGVETVRLEDEGLAIDRGA